MPLHRGQMPVHSGTPPPPCHGGADSGTHGRVGANHAQAQSVAGDGRQRDFHSYARGGSHSTHQQRGGSPAMDDRMGGCNYHPRTSPHRPSTPTTQPCSPGAWTTSSRRDTQPKTGGYMFASSDHDAVWAQVAAPTQHQRRQSAQWGPRRLTADSMEMEVVSQRPPARSGGPAC